MRILIHEANHSGHRLTGARILIDALLNLKDTTESIQDIIFATTSAALQSDQYLEQIKPVEDKVVVYVLPHREGSSFPPLHAYRQLMGLKDALEENSVDHLYLPYGDYQLQLLTILKFLPGNNWWPPKPVTEAQMMANSFAYPFGKRSRRIMSLMAVKYSGCDRVHLNDPLAISYLTQHHPESLKHVKGIPDSVTQPLEHSKAQARQQLNLPVNSRIIGCLGVINERKGVDILLRAFRDASLKPTDVLLLAGKASPGVKSLIKEIDDPRIVCMDYYLSEYELGLAVSAMDLIVTPYRKVVGSASIILRAAQSERMVLSSDTGWAGNIVKGLDLGLTAPIHDLPLFCSTLEQALSEAQQFTLSSAAKEFVAYNTEANLHEHWTALIKSRLDLSSNMKELDVGQNAAFRPVDTQLA